MDSITAFRSELHAEHSAETARLSRGLGWFSLAIGTAEIAIPRLLARGIGIAPSTASSITLRMMGVREIASGLHILLRPYRPLPLWMRVAGDVLDLGLLGAAAMSSRTSLPRLIGTAAAVAGVATVDVLAAVRTQRELAAANRPVIYSVTINKPPSEVYRFFRNFAQLPTFMDYLEEVREIDSTHSQWVAKTPLGKVSWKAEIVRDVPGELITWQSTEGSALRTAGRVTFAKTPGRTMTEVRVEMQLGFTGVGPSAALAKFFSKPQIKGDLRRLKQVLETGEVLLSDASARRRPHPAQPSVPEQITKDSKHPTPVFLPSPPTATKGVSR